jgi:O-acetyl-ADP-ribose deacetylase (regulator of RNase III)
MIKIIKKDITTVTKGIVAHGCNCLGVMGAGVALAIARKWPRAYECYKVHLNTRNICSIDPLGDMNLAGVVQGNELMVANCFTQRGVGFDEDGNPPADLKAIESSLRLCIESCNAYNLDLYTPQIGCGLGGLDWEAQIKPIYEKLYQELNESLEWYVCTI